MNDAPISEHFLEAVQECLADVDALVDRWSIALEAVTVYQEGLVSRQQVLADCRLVFVRLLTDIAEMPTPPDARNISERVGHSRALQGIPLADLMAAVRLDYRVMWEAVSSRLTTWQMSEVIASVPRIWDAIERHTQELTGAYMATQYGMAQVRQDERRLWFSRIQETDGRNHILNTRACKILSFSIDAHFAIFTLTEKLDTSLEHLHNAFHRQGFISHHQETEKGPVVLVQMDQRGELPLHFLHESHGLLLLDQVQGISLVPAAIRVALDLSTALPSTHEPIVRATDYWHVAVFQNPFDTGRLLSHRYLTRLRTLPAAEHKLLVQSAQVFLRSASIAEASRDLFCHRNTVTNRLDQIERLTDLDLRVPAMAALFLLTQAADSAQH